MKDKLLIIILGPTGVGKTALAIKVAEALKTEIISCDSRQIFKELSVGTAVPSNEELHRVKHHLIQTVSIADDYNASMFESDVMHILDKLYKTHDQVVMTGGSGLYADAVLHGIDDLPDISPLVRKELNKKFEEQGIEYLQQLLKKADPEYYKSVDVNNHKRLLKALEVYQITGKPYSAFLTQPKKKRIFKPVLIGLDLEREILYDRINRRVDQMVVAGLIEEARSCYSQRYLNSLNTVGYKELFLHFDGKLSLEEAIEKIKGNTRKYARKQLTWFRRYKDIRWFRPDEYDGIMDFITDQSVG